MTHIRFAGEDDIDGMAALLHHLFTQEHEFEPSAEAQRDGLRAILASPSIGRLLVAEDAGVLQGMANLLYTQSTALGGRVAILDDIILAPEARGRGLGRRLIDAAIDACRADGCRRITLHTDPDNHLAQALYERTGFARSNMLVYKLALPVTPGQDSSLFLHPCDS
jgi:ribosomal protein S18 acetylase RimI-like enzyme